MNASALRIEAYAPQHLDALVRLWRASFEHGVGITDPHPIAGQATFFEQKVLPDHNVQLAWRGEGLVGFVASNAESVSQLYVRVDCIGQGIGAQLLQLAKQGSAGSLWLFTFARNARARRFYARHGFVDVKHGFEPFWQLEDVRFEWTALPLAGPRVALRRLAPGDLAAFQAYRCDPELARYQGWSAQSDADARAFIDEMAAAPLFARGEWLQLAIAEHASDAAEHASGALVGDIGLHVAADGQGAEIGFTLSRPAQGRGLATEAVALALQLLWQQTTVAQVIGITDVRNTASLRLLERLGFALQERRDAVFKGEACVEAFYRLQRPAGA